MTLLLLTLLPLTGAFYLSAAPSAAPQLCSESFLLANGFSEGYLEHIAHRVHSLSLEDIRHYFEANATSRNFVPTVNLNMSSETERVLAHAPTSGHYTGFNTIGLNILDKVLRHMDRRGWGLTGYNQIEKIVHAFHMADMWQTMSEVYKNIEDPGEAVCGCITDVRNNGLWQTINKLALQIKYPGITSGEEDALKTEGIAKRSAHRDDHGHDDHHDDHDHDDHHDDHDHDDHHDDPDDHRGDHDHDDHHDDHGHDDHHDDHDHDDHHVYKRAADDGVYGEAVFNDVYKRAADDGVYREVVKKRSADEGVYGEAVFNDVYKRAADDGVYGEAVKKRAVKRSAADSEEELFDFDFSVSDAQLLEKAAKELVDGTKAEEARIVDEEGWFAWRDELIDFGGTDLYEGSNKDAAMFLYCTLKYKME